MSSVQSLANPHRIKPKRRRVRWRTSGRTVYAYVGNNPVSNVDPLGLKCSWLDQLMDNALHAATEFVQNHSDQTFTVDAGDILGVELSITVAETDGGINFSGRLGGGLGIGAGASAALIEGHVGSAASGWGWLLSGAGGNGITGGAASVSRINGGHWAAAGGVGVGFEGGASLTYGYSGNIGTIPMKSLSSAMSSNCGCH